MQHHHPHSRPGAYPALVLLATLLISACQRDHNNVPPVAPTHSQASVDDPSDSTAAKASGTAPSERPQPAADPMRELDGIPVAPSKLTREQELALFAPQAWEQLQ